MNVKYKQWLIAGDGRFVYALNGRGVNYFSAHVMDAHTPDDELRSIARLIAAAPDHAAIARALCFGIARWEPFPSTSHGEFCIGGMRHVTSLDEFGVPVMTSGMRAAIAAATGETK